MIIAFSEDRLFAALVLLVTALFLAAGYLPAAPWRRHLRRAAVAGFLFALAVALVRIAFWLIIGDNPD